MQTVKQNPDTDRVSSNDAAPIHCTITPLQKIANKIKLIKTRKPSRYMARCPAHDDHDPSLAVTENQDGTLLVRCFAECSTYQVLQSIGLEFRDLFPQNGHEQERSPIPKKQRWDPWGLLRQLRFESEVVEHTALKIENLETLTADDRRRLKDAVTRINKIAEVSA